MGGFGGGMNQGRMDIQLTPRASRPLTASQIAQQLRGPLGRYPGFRAFVNVPAALQIGGFRGNSNYNVTVESLNTDELYTWAPPRCRSEVSGAGRLAQAAQFQDAGRCARSARIGRAVQGDGWSADGEPRRAVAGRVGVVQSAAGRLAGRRGRQRHAGREARAP